MEPISKKSKVSMMTMNQSQTKSVGNIVKKSVSRLKMRKQSYGFGTVPGVRPPGEGARYSQLGLEFKRPQLIYLNTYQLDPRLKFHVPTVTKIINALLDAHFNGHKYNVQDSPALTMGLAGEILRQVRSIGYNRYRIISVVTIGQKRAQCYNNAISFLWDHERDSYVSTDRELTTVFIQVTVFGIYLD